MTELEKIFAEKETENGDIAYNTTGNHLLDLLFMSAYFEKHLEEAHIGNSHTEQVFSAFMRDPRFGLGRRDLGRKLLKDSGVSFDKIVKCGRFDDILYINQSQEAISFLINECLKGNELAKKWMPRLNGRTKKMAQAICKMSKLTEKEYRQLIKCNTTESKLSQHRTEEINFEQVPSLAMIKYYRRFLNGEDTAARFAKYLEDVKKGDKKLNISTANVYDIYRNKDKIDATMYFNELEKIEINCIPILDTSGSMWDSNDSIGKANCIAHYLAKCSTYAPNQVISFSSRPKLMTIRGKDYNSEIESMYTGDCSDTNWAETIKLLADLKKFPDYFIVLSDMEFNQGSRQSNKEVFKMFDENNIKTKIVWWNFNSRNQTVTFTAENNRCIYLSGYSPILLKYLESGFNGEKFLDNLLNEYIKNINK